METDTEIHFKEEIPTKKIPLSPQVFRALKRKAKAENRTPDECAQSLLLRAMNMDYIPADCPYCEKEIWIPKIGPPITHEAFQQFVKDYLLEMKQERKRA
jgi:transposase-like protein